ncbi:MAG TPA: SGNH/GDSL hydrolase family protein [Candidatus Binatia bacterium]
MTREDLVLVAMVGVLVASGVLAVWWTSRLRVRANEIRWPAKLGLSALTTLLCVATALLGLELFYRFVYDATDSFALTKTSLRWFERHYRYNSWNVRDDVEYAVAKTPGRRRIAFLGDSFTVGHGVPDVGERFANRIRTAHPEWEVHVLARNGLDTGAQLALMEATFARGYETDDLVLVYCLNDIGDLLPDWRAVIDGLYEEVSAAGFLVHHSYAVNQLYFRLLRVTTPQLDGYFPRLRAAYEGEVWHRQAQRLAALAELAKQHDARFAVATFPFVHALGPDYPFEEAHRRLAALWQSLGVPHLDLRDAFADVPPASLVVNADDAHPNETAHALAAEALAAFLRDDADGTEPAALQ